MSCPVAEPPWLADLPRLNATYPEGDARPPAFQKLPGIAASYSGQTASDPARSIAVGLRNKCSMCGCTLGRPAYNVFFSHPEEQWGRICEYPGGLFTMTAQPPMHKSCALYSALACPFFKHESSRRTRTPEKLTRGPVMEILSFSHYGLVLFTEPQIPDFWRLGPYPRWGYFGFVERIRFRTPKELLPMYDEVVAADAKEIDISTRLYMTDSPEDERRRTEYWQAAATMARMPALVPDTHVNGYKYKLAMPHK